MPLVSESKQLNIPNVVHHHVIEIEDEHANQSLLSFKQEQERIPPMQKLQSMEKPTFVGVAI